MSQTEIVELCNETGFSPQEIKRIYKRFIALHTLKRGYITVQDLMAGVPEVEKNPLAERLCKVFTAKTGDASSNQIDFKEFVKALALFHTPHPTSEEDKLAFLFRMYDTDGDGLLSQEEIRSVLKQLVGSSLNETQLIQIV